MQNFVKKYDFILSLGRCCHVTDLLAKNGLKCIDGPWDWSGTAYKETIYNRIKSLYNGFNGFFDKKNFVDFEPYKDDLYKDWFYEALRPININSNCQKTENVNPEKPYYNKKTKTYYMHDFHKYPDFDTQFLNIKEKYMRRARRTLNFIKFSESILLVYMSHIADQRRDLYLDNRIIVKLMSKLRKKYPNKIIDLFIFDHDSKFHGENFYRDVIDVGIIRYVSNHDDVFPETDENPKHIADGLMMPKSICYILSKIELTDRHIMI